MKRHGELENDVLQYLGLRRTPAFVRDVHAALQVQRPLAYTTVMTVLDRLSRKGLVVRNKEGRAWMYQATEIRPRPSVTLAESEHEAEQPSAVLMHFVKGLSDDQVDELRTMLDRRSGS